MAKKKKKKQFQFPQRKKSNKPQWELENLAHLNSIQDERDGGNRGVTYGRAI